MAEERYRLLSIYDADGDATKNWYIQYYFPNPETGIDVRIKETLNINREHDPIKRRKLAKEALAFVKSKLEDGFNPFTGTMDSAPLHPSPQISKITKVTETNTENTFNPIRQTVESVVTVLSKNGTDSSNAYNIDKFNRLIKFLEAKKYEHMDITQFNYEHCYEFQAYMKDEMHLRKTTVNPTISQCGLFWEQPAIRKIVNGNNPFRQVVALKDKDYRGINTEEMKQDVDFVPLTADEMDTILEYFNIKKAYDFLRVFGMIYYAWARPVEISRLKIGDIDLKNKSIRFLKGVTKNGRYDHIQIVEPLYELLLPMQMKRFPSNYFLFSRDLKPGPVQAIAYKHYTERWWNPHVVETLEIDKKMYAGKHSGNIAYLQDNKGNVDSKWQQKQNRHSSLSQLEVYIKKLGVYFVETGKFKFRKFILDDGNR